MTPISLNRLILLISILLCVQVHAESLWINADSLKESVGSGNEWDEWQPEEIEGWKYIENFGAFFPWSNWIYHLDHGWLYPVAGPGLTMALSSDLVCSSPFLREITNTEYDNVANLCYTPPLRMQRARRLVV